MISVEPLSLNSADEELGAVGIRAGVRHGEDAGAGVFQFEVFVVETAAVDRLTSGAVAIGDVCLLYTSDAADDP